MQNNVKMSTDVCCPLRKKARRKPTQKICQEEEESKDKEDGECRPDPGTIKRVRMRNFMCHQDFTFEPNRSMTFLCGANGSGKSAVLAAVVFGLGGSARLTGRGGADRDLVRSGQREAVVEVTLHNGAEGFRPSVYGDTITVVRTVMGGGRGRGGGYRFLDSSERTVKVRKPLQELREMLHALMIQVDNPVAVLTQDGAKNFLSDSDPSRLYDFFMRGTLLADCRREYESAAGERTAAEALMAEKEAHLPRLEKEAQRWVDKLDCIQDAREKERRVDEKKRELLWALEGRARGVLDRVLEEKERWLKKIAECDRLIEEEGKRKDELVLERKRTQREIQEIAAKAQKEQDAVQELRTTWRKRSDEERLARHSLNRIRNDHAKASETVRLLEDKIRELNDRRGDTEECERLEQERAEEISRLEEELEDGERRLEAHQEGEVSQAEDRNRMLMKEIGSLEMEKATLRSHIRIKEGRLRSLRASRYAVHGDRMERLVGALRRKKSEFQHMPTGPIGDLVRLRPGVRSGQAAAVESKLAKILCGFVVHSFQDRIALMRMQRSLDTRFPVITVPLATKRHDVSAGRSSHPEIPTILDLLEIEDPNVFNVLVDQEGIEQILVIPTDGQARELLDSEENVPQNCREAVTEQRSKFFPAPCFRCYPLWTGEKKSQVLSNNQEEIIKDVTDEIKLLRASMSAVFPRIETLRKSRRAAAAEAAKAAAAAAELQARIKEVRIRLGELRSAAAMAAEVEKPASLTALEEDLEEYRELLDNLSERGKKAEEEFTEASEAEKKAREEYEERQREMDENQDPEALSARLERLAVGENRCASDLRHYGKKKGDYWLRLEAVEEELQVKEGEHRKLLERASGSNSSSSSSNGSSQEKRPAQGGSVAEVTRQLKRLEEIARSSRAVKEPLSVVTENLEESRRLLRVCRRRVRHLRRDIGHLSGMLLAREDAFRKIRDSLSRRVRAAFHVAFLTRRQSGGIDFDHRRGRLELRVGGGGGGAEVRRHLKTLSGGERSYATVSLVLALWEVTASPFRILDEFDVFMDALNRRVAVEQIGDHARRRRRGGSGRQLVLLTPLDVPGVRVGEDTSVVKMEKSAE